MSACTIAGYVYCVDRDLEPHAPEILDFGIRDARGRAIGYTVTRRTIYRLEREGSHGHICPREDLGRWFTADTHATRNGIRFGASSGTLRARTLEELETMLAARVAGARARYAAAAARLQA